MESNLIITLSGKAHVGKDLVGELFKRYCEEMGMTGFTLAFADSLKNHCMRNLGYYDKDKDRKILQDFGTRVREIEPEFWARQVYTTIDAFRSMFDVFIITDCRYENEMNLYPYRLVYPNGNILVKRDVEGEIGEVEASHESEQLADQEDKFHYIIDNNGTIEETYEQVRDIFNDILLKKADFVHNVDDMVEQNKDELKEIIDKFLKDELDG